MDVRNASKAAREVNVADRPEATCSTRPRHTGLDGPGFSRNCTTNARCTDRVGGVAPPAVSAPHVPSRVPPFGSLLMVATVGARAVEQQYPGGGIGWNIRA